MYCQYGHGIFFGIFCVESTGQFAYSLLITAFGVRHMSGIMTEIEARELLGPHHDALFTCVHNAYSRWVERGAGLVSKPDSSFRSQAIQQLMVDEARQRFGDVSGVRIFERKKEDDEPSAGRFLLSFEGKALVQFKKFDPDFRTRNYPTSAALDFDRQEALPNVPIGTRLSVGYQLDTRASALAAVAVVCQGSYKPYWWYELEDAGHGMVGLPPAAPLRPAQVRAKEQMDLVFDQGKDKG
jgi:hypothetical protein